MEYKPVIKKNETISFAAMWTDLGIIILTEASQREKDRHHMVLLICRLLKNDTNELIHKTETDSQT